MTRSTLQKTTLRRLLLRRLIRNERGAVAVEFGILAPFFFAVLAATLETALVFFAGQILDSGVHDTSRLIRTGQVQEAHMTAADFRGLVCDKLYGLFDCGKIMIVVRNLPNFAGFSTALPYDDDGEWTIENAFSPGEGMTIVVVEVYYKWPAILNIPGLNLGITPDGKRLLAAVRVFRNEPFS